MTDYGISGRIALLVGSTGTVGRAVGRALVGQGVRLITADRRESDVDGLTLALTSDLSSPHGIADILPHTRAVGPIQLLVVTSGAYRGGQPIETTSVEDFEELHWANAALPWHILRTFVPDLRETHGRAVLIGALGAERSGPRQTPYNASKTALHSIVQTVAREVADSGASVNALLPLVIDHEVNRRRPDADPSRWVSPERLAQVVAFLLSDAAQDINGALIPVPGRM